MRARWMTVATVALIALVVVASAVVVSARAQSQAGSSESAVPRYQHIFYIMMENHSYGEIIGSAYAPQINALAQEYGLATSYYGVTHPSEPNYVAAIGGSYFGIQDDAPYNVTANGVNHTITGPSLASQLEAKGLSWKTYQQALPYAGFTGYYYPSQSVALYASKHNPFLNFASVQSNPAELQKIVPDTQLATDLASGDVPDFSFIVPDQCHDMHGISSKCSGDATIIPAGDAYVAQTVSAIMGSRTWQQGNNAIVITWDENDFNPSGVTGCCNANPGGGHVATIVITNHGARHVQDAAPYNHYSLLRTIQQAFRLDCMQNTCDTANVKLMTPLFANGNR